MVFRVEFKVFAIMLSIRIAAEVQPYLSNFQFAFLRGRGTADEHYIAKQLFRAICARGKRAMAVHVDYEAAFDSLSHIYLFHSLEKAGASPKSLQLFKATYTNARVVAKVGALLSAPCSVGRGVLEGDINSPMYFNVGLETVFREADDICSQLGLSRGIKLREVTYDRIAFADDVTETGEVVSDMSHRLQILELSSDKAGLRVSRAKSCVQHIGYSRDVPAVTADDIEALQLKFECPKQWCTQRFANSAAVRSHVLWHDRREGGRVDQNELVKGQIVGARGPPEHRFYLVFWDDGRRRWLLHKCFTPTSQHTIDQFFLIHFYLDRCGSLGDPTESR